METIAFLPDLPSFPLGPPSTLPELLGRLTERCSELHLSRWRLPAPLERAQGVGPEPPDQSAGAGWLVLSAAASVRSRELGKPRSAPGGAEVWRRGLETSAPAGGAAQGVPRGSSEVGGRWRVPGGPWAVARRAAAGLSPPPLPALPPSSPLLGEPRLVSRLFSTRGN